MNEALVKNLKEIRGFVLAEWGNIEPRIKEVAIALCSRDGVIDPDEIVVGYHNNWGPVVTGNKKMPVFFSPLPLRPAWSHYITEAREMLAICGDSDK